VTKLVTAAIVTVILTGIFGGTAFAGEVTGNGKPTPVAGHLAASICSFSGLEDLSDSPLRTQTPHAVFDNGEIVFPPPGTPGFACSPGRPVE
jgi:hypothetical protein